MVDRAVWASEAIEFLGTQFKNTETADNAVRSKYLADEHSRGVRGVCFSEMEEKWECAIEDVAA